MKRVKTYEEIISEKQELGTSLILENKFKKFMSSLGRHAVSAIISYFHENPDALKEVLVSMKSSKDQGVQGALKEIR